MPRVAGRSRGFTLIELLVVLTVSAIMVGLAVPSFRNFTASQRVKSAASQFTGASLLARSEAIKRNATITVAPTGAWEGGWTTKAGATTLQQVTAMGGVTITVKQASDDAAVSAFSYASNGRLSTVCTGSCSSTPASKLLFKSTSGSSSKCVEVGVNGILSQVSCP